MRRELVAITCAGVMACGAGTGTRDRIRSADEITDDYKARVGAVYEKGFREMVWPRCEDPKRPSEAACGYIADGFLSREHIDLFRSTVCKERLDEPVSDLCFERFRDDYFGRLEARYPRAVGDNVKTQCIAMKIDCSKFVLLEIAAMAAHNAAVRTGIRAQVDALLEEHRAEQLKRGRQVETIERARAQEAAAWQAIAAGIGGAARGMNEALQASEASRSPEAVVRSAPQCSSDLECGIGNVCVKAQLQMTGFCARAVNEYGVQTYPAPRPNLGPGGPGQCSFDTECPIGFRCLKNGALTGNCVK